MSRVGLSKGTSSTYMLYSGGHGGPGRSYEKIQSKMKNYLFAFLGGVVMIANIG
jgi:hypothetical protein